MWARQGNAQHLAGSAWNTFFRAAGIAAAVIVLATVIDVASAMLWYTEAHTIPEWYALFQQTWLLGLRDLGLLDMAYLSLNVIVYLAFYGALRRVNQPFAALAVVLAIIGATIGIANNGALAMFSLSREFAVASETQKPALIAAGEAVMALGAHSSPGTFMGFLFTNAAGILISLVMRRSAMFVRWSAWTGVFGFCALLIFNVLSAFLPAADGVSMLFAGAGGLLFMAWYGLAAGSLFRLGRARG